MYKSGKWSSALKSALMVTPMLVMSMAGVRSTSAAPAQQSGPQTFSVTAGHEIFTEEGNKSSWQSMRYYSDNITINVGDTVNWKFDSGVEPHTVSFLAGTKFPDFVLPEPQTSGPPKLSLNPQVALPAGGATFDGTTYTNSGVISADSPGPKDYSLQFTKPGTYTYVCILHAVALPDGTIVGMQGKVTVQAAGSAYPKTNAQYQSDAKAMMDADEKDARANEPKAKAQMVSTRPGPNGTTVHHVNSGYQIAYPTYTIEYMRFSPTDLNLSVGDTLEWSSPTPHSFHNVLFGEEPDVFLVEPQTSGPPKMYFNSDVAMPAGTSTYSGTGLYSSGILVGPQDPPQAGASTYSLTFSQPGRFEYICALHYHNGMDGRVIVADKTGTGSTPGMPSTGNSDYTLIIVGALAVLVLASAGVALRLRKVGVK